MSAELIGGRLSAEVKIRFANGRTLVYKIADCKQLVVKSGSMTHHGGKYEIQIEADAVKVESNWPVTIDAEPTAHVQTKGMLPAPSVQTQAPENAHVQYEICEGCGCKRTPTHEQNCPL